MADTDYTKMDGPQLLEACAADASKWATAFCQHAEKNGLQYDEGWMISWFANCIESAAQRIKREAA